MKQSLKINLFITAIIVLFTGCEYDISGEYNQDISKPQDSLPAEITLSLGTDSVFIYENTEVTCDLNTFGLNCNQLEIEYLDKKLDFVYKSILFTITPDYKIKDWVDLKAKFYISTGTGSIADNLKLENYVGSKTWKMLFVKLSDFKVELKQHINRDSLVELYWIKPKYMPVIESTINTEKYSTRINGDTTFFTLEDYCGGSKNIDLTVKSIKDRYFTCSLALNYPIPEVSVVQEGPDSCRIISKSDIRLNYYVNGYLVPDSSFLKTTSLSYKVGIPDFGAPASVVVKLVPYAFTFNDSGLSSFTKYIDCASGIRVPNNLTYCKSQDKIIYFDEKKIAQNSGFQKYETFTFPLPSDYKGIGNTRGMYPNYFCNTSGSLILDVSNCVLFTTENSKYEPFFGYSTTNNNAVDINSIQVADNNCIGYTYYNLALPTYELVNKGDDISWSKLSFVPDLTGSSTDIYISNLTLTQNGKYLCCRGATDFIIYDLSDHKTAKKVFTTPIGNCLSVISNPNQPNEIIVMTKNGFELRRCPDFELLGRFVDPDMKGVRPINVDPYSNILLGWSSLNFHFYNLSTMTEILRIKGPWGEWNNTARLYRNYMFNESRAMDLTKYFAN